MSRAAPLICLITPGHLASTPRLVKNADALVAAGYRVHVVSGRHFPPADILDAGILAHAKWSCTRVDYHSGARGLLRRILRKLDRRRISGSPPTWQLAARAHHAGFKTLSSAAAHTGAHLFFGHGGVVGLATAAAAAQARARDYGFDAEDWHEDENTDRETDSVERSIIQKILRDLLPAAAPLTCAAPLIGHAYTAAYGVQPTCILNVFPLAESPGVSDPTAPVSDQRPAVLYWFSQTIGPHRGLEPMIAVLTRMQTPAVLHLRGFVSSAYRDALRTQAGPLADRIVFLPPAPAAEMARLAAGADLGLSLEQSTPRNRDLCLTNKIFTYLLAGLPVALTPTAAQRALLPELGPAAVPLNLSDPSGAALALDQWFTRRDSLPAQHARRLARERFNWDFESTKLVDAIRQKLGHP